MVKLELSQAWLEQATKHEIEDVIHQANVVLRSRFSRGQEPKYGRLCRHLSQRQLQVFFSAIPPHLARERFAFYSCFLFGLRIGELLRLNVEDVDLVNGVLAIHSEKSGNRDRFLPIPLTWVPDYDLIVEKYKHFIDAHRGFVFFSDKRDRLVWCSGYLRRVFRSVCEFPQCRDVGLNKVYGKTRDGRPMFLFTVHSLRHSCGKLACDMFGVRKAADWLGHRSMDSTMVYTKTTTKELREVGDSLDSGLSFVK